MALSASLSMALSMAVAVAVAAVAVAVAAVAVGGKTEIQTFFFQHPSLHQPEPRIIPKTSSFLKC